MSFGTGGNTDKILQASLTIYDISYYIKQHRNLNEFKLCTCINASTLLLITKAMSFGTGGNTAKILQASLTIYDISYYIKQHRNLLRDYALC